MLEITKLRHAYPEAAGFTIDRQHGYHDYTLLHFFNEMVLKESSGTFQTKPHAVIIYNRFTPQYFTSNTNILHDWIHFRGDIAAIMKENGLKFDTIYYPSSTDFITDLTQEMENEFHACRYGYKKLLSIKLDELLIKLGRAINGQPEINHNLKTAEKFKSLREKMFSSLGESWTADKMASEVNFSKSRFFAVYRSIYGTAPNDDLIKARIEGAKNMLSFTDKSITEISSYFGYENISHFIRQFKKFVGSSPGKYRQTKQQQNL